MAKKPLEARVRRYIDRWKGRLLLNHWSVIIDFHDKDCVNPPNEIKTLADMTTHPRYSEARLGIYPNFFKEPTGNQEATALHELCHIITEPIRETLQSMVHKGQIAEKKKDDLIEGLTENFSKIIWRAYTRSRKNLKGYIV